MGKRIRYIEEFKLGAGAQVTDKGHSVVSVARRLGVSTKSLYDWVKRYSNQPSTGSAEGDEVKRLKAELERVIKQCWLESGCVYGNRKIHHALVSLGEGCAANMVAKLMRNEGLRAHAGSKRNPGKYGTKLAVVAANQLQQGFNVGAPDCVWVTDITYIRTHEGWLYLAAVIDL